MSIKLMFRIIYLSAFLLSVIFIYFLNSYAPEPNIRISTKNISTPRNNFHIIINTIPKSASVYITKVLEVGLRAQFMPISPGYFPTDNLSYVDLDNFFKQNFTISKSHMNASIFNQQLLKKYTDRIVVQLRDPREVLLSWVHYLNRINQEDKTQYLYYISPTPPKNYYEWELSKQIDWNIENFLPGVVLWMEGWINLKDTADKLDNGFKILLTTYDEFKNDEVRFYANILNFYNIPNSQFHIFPQSLDMSLHYRKGDQSEWRQVYTTEQKNLILKRIPAELLKRFNWST